MAIRKQALATPPWAQPIWPDRLPDESSLRLVYGGIADELVVHFEQAGHEGGIVVPITTPEFDYAGLIVAMDTGSVIGVHVYPLAAFAVQRHPAWQAATASNPLPEVAQRIVRDIKHLFDRYGVEPPGPERG